MKKTLLIAAAALAASLISSQAQVYSQNIVGYVNQPIPAGGYQIVGNSLLNGSDSGATNGDINTCFQNLVSSPNDPPSSSTNSQILVWNGSGYVTYYYFNQADATTWEGFASPAGFYDLGGSQANVHLTGGQAAFIYNHSGSPLTVTTVGTVMSTNASVINAGYNLISLQVPIVTNMVGTTFGLPLNMSSSPLDPPNQSRNDTLYSWTGSGYVTYYYFNQADATAWEGFAAPAGFYDLGGSAMPVGAVQVNQGFFLYHSGSTIPWNSSFSTQ